MKRFIVALLAVAMAAGFALSASAADVKFGGSYYVMGATANDWQLSKNGNGSADDRTTASFFAQRLRVGTQFKVAEGLTLTTQFDALEGRWGQFGRYQNEEMSRGTAGGWNGADGANDSKNISFDRAYVDFAIPYGKIRVGRGPTSNWGTSFANQDADADEIVLTGYFGNFTAEFKIEKAYESVGDGVTWGTRHSQADGDNDRYHISGVYKFTGGSTGLKIFYNRNAQTTYAAPSAAGDRGYKREYWAIQPYVQATLGPVFVEAELNYNTGRAYDYEDNGVMGSDRNLKGMNAYLHAKVDAGPAYFGALYAYVSGQDPKSKTFNSGSDGGKAWNQNNLILWGYYSNKWAGMLGGGNGALYGQTGYDYIAMTNAHELKVYAGYNPTSKWNIQGSVAYAVADKTCPSNVITTAANRATYDYVDHKYGTEADLTASYKIFDNLTYTLGFGYLWAGDYFKGTNKNANVDDTYLLLNKLDLTF
ncbi:MAG: hypothetical protein A4E66_02193 [Syntrophus sp. PtaB.Bin001]|nr:MAG: hypothetical protein A4E66_02193 [Syntrophus sp. PtaB.Bin001]